MKRHYVNARNMSTFQRLLNQSAVINCTWQAFKCGTPFANKLHSVFVYTVQCTWLTFYRKHNCANICAFQSKRLMKTMRRNATTYL